MVTASATDARGVALAVLRRVEDDGAYANLVLPAELGRGRLDERDRGLVTELVYGLTRMRRACDFLVDRFLARDVDADIRRVLRLGAYQLHFLATPPHAAVSTSVDLAPRRARGLVNAVLRKVADAGPSVAWPDDATRLSYPDWVVARLTADLGHGDAVAALARMNDAPRVTERADGYVQDRASQWVAELVGAQEGERVADVCAAPGGKATLLARWGATVVAGDVAEPRVALVRTNAERLDVAGAVQSVVGDARRPPHPPSSFDRVLVDAPCSGLGVLRRRPDARWRIDAAAVDRLAALQRAIVDAAAVLVRPGGTLVYSVCTLTAAESLVVDEHVAAALPSFEAIDPPGPPWRPWGRGALLLPHDADTDGMALFRYRRIGA
jgi:16S rRNA (cytosine967-C5)-methyltransferase